MRSPRKGNLIVPIRKKGLNPSDMHEIGRGNLALASPPCLSFSTRRKREREREREVLIRSAMGPRLPLMMLWLLRLHPTPPILFPRARPVKSQSRRPRIVLVIESERERESSGVARFLYSTHHRRSITRHFAGDCGTFWQVSELQFRRGVTTHARTLCAHLAPAARRPNKKGLRRTTTTYTT